MEREQIERQLKLADEALAYYHAPIDPDEPGDGWPAKAGHLSARVSSLSRTLRCVLEDMDAQVTA